MQCFKDFLAEITRRDKLSDENKSTMIEITTLSLGFLITRIVKKRELVVALCQPNYAYSKEEIWLKTAIPLLQHDSPLKHCEV